MTQTIDKKIPIAKGYPLLGSATYMLKDPVAFMVDQYQQLGPVFRIKAPATNFLLLAGPEANRFMQKHGQDYFSAADAWSILKEEFKADRFILASDGEDHFEMRRIMKRGYSPAIIKDKMPEVIGSMKEFILKHETQKDIYTVDFMQRLVTKQLGFFLTNTYAEDYFTELRYFIRTAINMVGNRLPPFTVHYPKYKRAKEKSYELARVVLDKHRNNPNPKHMPDFIDDVLAVNEGKEGYFSENDLLTAALSPFIAGLDTVANTISYLLYDLLKNPEILEKIRKDIDEVFEDGLPDMNKLRHMKLLHAITLETLRLHPTAPAQIRRVVKDFDFQGFTIKKDEKILIPMVLTHFLPEFFPDPYKYDVERYAPPRNEHRQPSLYAPFGLGPHICSGNKLAEVLLMAMTASLVRYADFEPLPKDYNIGLDTNPIPGPSRKATFKIKNFRDVKC